MGEKGKKLERVDGEKRKERIKTEMEGRNTGKFSKWMKKREKEEDEEERAGE